MGQEVVRGVEAEKWQFKERSEDKITKYTLYVSYTVSIDFSCAPKFLNLNVSSKNFSGFDVECFPTNTSAS